jgi:hypothetical protein
MNDKEIEAIDPEWGRLSKKKRDEVFREYQTFSFNDSSVAWRALEEKGKRL